MAQESENKLTREDFDAGPSSVDEILPGLFLGNLTTATDVEWLKEERISHILSVDSCPLPRKILEFLPTVNMKYICVTDMPREDLLTHFEDSYEFIDYALESNGRILVHCYFGVSRSSTIVIAYVMKKYAKGFADAFDMVKKKRRFVSPNSGFQAQLRLYEDMGFYINNTNAQFKMYKLHIAADKVMKAKILPQSCTDLIKPDPGLTTIRPEPTVYRCKKCRRIVASASNLLPHLPRENRVWRHVTGKRGSRQIMLSAKESPDDCGNATPVAPTAVVAKKKIAHTQDSEFCTKIYFVEPMAWMPDITHNVEGKLNCPKCKTKLGSFSWIAGSQCPCGSKIAPAFYLVPSKLDWSNAVQNIEVTV